MQTFSNTVLIEINRNNLRLLTSDQKSVEISIDQAIVNDTKIVSKDEFFQILKSAFKSLNSKVTKAVFIVSEKEIYDRFFVVRNDQGDVFENLRTQALEFAGTPLEELYCTYQKMSPFVYQFIGIPKDVVNTYLELSEGLGLKLDAVLPMSFVFAQFVGSLSPFFFVHKGVDESALVASEYGGVYFSGTYNSTADINEKTASLIKELSAFNREKPVTDIYYVGDALEIPAPFVAHKVELPTLGDTFQQFERLVMAGSILSDRYEDITGAYYNFKNVLHLELGTPNQTSIVKYTVPALAVLSVLVLGFFGFNYLNKASVDTNQKSEVIGASDNKQEPKTDVKEEVKEPTPTPVLLDKSLLKIRVENGVGVAGMATKTKTVVEGYGYKVSEVGDADKTGYEKSQLKVKSSKKDYLDILKKDLSEKFELEVTDSLDETKGYDVLLVVGKK